MRGLDGPRGGRPPQRPVGGVDTLGPPRRGQGPEPGPAASTGWPADWPTRSTRPPAWPGSATTPTRGSPRRARARGAADRRHRPRRRHARNPGVGRSTSTRWPSPRPSSSSPGGGPRGSSPRDGSDGLAFEASDLDVPSAARAGPSSGGRRSPCAPRCAADGPSSTSCRATASPSWRHGSTTGRRRLTGGSAGGRRGRRAGARLGVEDDAAAARAGGSAPRWTTYHSPRQEIREAIPNDRVTPPSA